MRSITTFPGLPRSILFRPWFLFFIYGTVFSQPVLRGKISDRNGIALPGATVRINDTNNFTISDSAGNFALRASPGNVITISFIRYREHRTYRGNRYVG